MKISVVIPVYKNHELFLKNLRHNFKFLKGCEVVIVDDDPASDLKKKLTGFKVVYLKNSKNLGFAGACNRGVREATGDYVLLLNSDVAFKKGNLQKIVEKFEEDKSLFAISFLQIDEGKKVGRNFLYWHQGFFEHKGVENFKAGINAWAEGGASLFDRKKFLRLGGFLEIYSPFYWEDIDLSYRAWKAGFKVLFSPELVFDHKHESSIGKYFQKEKILQIAYRNSFFCHWINLSDKSLLFSHFLFLPLRILRTCLASKEFFLGFILALKALPKVLNVRKKVQKMFVLSDKEILSYFKRKILTNAR